MRNLLFTLLATAIVGSAQAVVPNRTVIPDIKGYITLKGDFHIHTIFSDANVWPTTRVGEAVMDGLDFIAITDHVDDRHQKMVKAGLFICDRNESYRIAAKEGEKRGVMVIHGGEITRGMSPGHFNTLFDTDCEAIAAATETFATDNFKAVESGLKEAQRQGAFTYWNHPNWASQAPNETKWYDEHTTLYEAGLMQGIEVFNYCDRFSPEAFGWALERNLTLLSGTDCHVPMFEMVDYAAGEVRPMTLVFTKERSLDGIREALDARRTAIFAEGMVYGREDVLKPFVDAMIEISNVKVTDKKVTFKIVNHSSIPLRITKAPGSERLTYTRQTTINPFEELTFSVSSKEPTESFDVHFTVENFWIGVDKGLPYSLHFNTPKK